MKFNDFVSDLRMVLSDLHKLRQWGQSPVLKSFLEFSDQVSVRLDRFIVDKLV